MFGWRQKRTGDGRFTFDRKPVKPRTMNTSPSRPQVDPNWDVPAISADNPFAEIIANNWDGRDGFLSNHNPAPTTSTATSQDPWEAVTDTSDYRFGPSNISHARIDDTRQRIQASLSTPYATSMPDSQGQRKQVEMTFNPTHAREDIRRLAAQVLEANKEISGGSSYEPHTNVYSARTIKAAQRIYFNHGQETFDGSTHERESTSWFPCTTHTTTDGVRYDYTIHPTIGDLIHGARDDQRQHSGLTADVHQHTTRPRRSIPAPW